jgi:hypothetical protein
MKKWDQFPEVGSFEQKEAIDTTTVQQDILTEYNKEVM